MAKRGRPIRAIEKRDLAPYVEAVSEFLPVVFAAVAHRGSTLLEEVAYRWTRTPVVSEHQVPKDDGTVSSLLHGKRELNRSHLIHLHHVLGLSEYQLGSEETWLVHGSDGHETIRPLSSFREFLSAAQSNTRDPFSLIKKMASLGTPWIALHPSLQPRPLASNRGISPMILRTEDEPPPPPRPEVVRVRPRSWSELRFSPAVDGRVLLFAYRPPQFNVVERFLLLNDYPELGCARGEVYRAGQQITTSAFELTGFSGPNELLCVNWPSGLDAQLFDEGLFNVSLKKKPAELVRSIAVAMMKTSTNSLHTKVHAGFQSILVDELEPGKT